MVDTITDRKLYKIPTNEIPDNRRKLFGLKREIDESTKTWLNRVCSQMDLCDFPKSIEYILTDKFMCELSNDERALIRGTDTNWSLKCEFVCRAKKKKLFETINDEFILSL